MLCINKRLTTCLIKTCRFEIIDGVKYVSGIKHAYKFVLREQVGFAAVLCLYVNRGVRV